MSTTTTPPHSLDPELIRSIEQLVEQIPEPFRRGLLEALDVLRKGGSPAACLVLVASVIEGQTGLLGAISDAANVEFKGHVLEEQIYWLAGQKGRPAVIPGVVGADLHWIRVRANKIRHNDPAYVATAKDAVFALRFALGVFHWFYCQYDLGPKLPDIVPPVPLPSRRRHWVAALLAVVVLGSGLTVFLASRGTATTDEKSAAQPLPPGSELPGETMKSALAMVKRLPEEKRTKDGKPGLDDLGWLVEHLEELQTQSALIQKNQGAVGMVFISDPLPRCGRALRLVCDRFQGTTEIVVKPWAGVTLENLVIKHYPEQASFDPATKEIVVTFPGGVAERDVVVIGLLVQGPTQESLKPFEPQSIRWRVE